MPCASLMPRLTVASSQRNVTSARGTTDVSGTPNRPRNVRRAV